eukprot:Blabericola_migrator_1__234@NODE_1061_length_5558_cov_570_766891_g729_i0_p1_GENE_NODE_1061_length_5558_cov_570_766891_g729_i0NODE_1061_length_5558_cov_570_766891_g729_i0_p1_ORF_typecomplete_len606_score73_87Exostosin/PF03016_15/5_2e10_NODE_1061_length_5558_cov_570_766891_g729_i015673384
MFPLPQPVFTLAVIAIVFVSTAAVWRNRSGRVQTTRSSYLNDYTEPEHVSDAEVKGATSGLDNVVPAMADYTPPTAMVYDPHPLDVLMNNTLVDYDTLESCPVNQYENRPPELLCRRLPTFSQETLDYIKTLGIPDLDFYDVFEEHEIPRYFKPRPNRDLIEIALYDGEASAQGPYTEMSALMRVQRFQAFDVENSLYTSYLVHANRVSELKRDGSKVGMTFLPMATSRLYWFNNVKDKSPQEKWIMWVRENLIDNKQFPRSDIFSSVGEPYGYNLLLNKSRDWIAGNSVSSEQGLSDMPLRTTLFVMKAAPFLAPCQVILGATPIARLRLVRHFPRGGLPSATYAMGALAHLSTRPYNFWSTPQYNQSLMYQNETVRSLSGQYSPSALIGEFNMEDIRDCAVGEVEGCRTHHDHFHLDQYAYLLQRSKFALVLPDHDNWGSPRLGDVIASGAIPIIVSTKQIAFGVPGQCHIPWRDMAIWIEDEEYAADPKAAIEKHVLSKTPVELEKILRILEYYRFDVLHPPAITRVPVTRTFQAIQRCLPEAWLMATQKRSKTEFPCDFEDFSSTPAFLNESDEDDEPAWSSSWYQPITKLQAPEDLPLHL